MREALIAIRKKKELSLRQMAKKCQCSETLIYGIEELDWITHPDIAAQIAAEYGLDVDGYNQLVHKVRRVETLPKPERKRKKALRQENCKEDQGLPFQNLYRW